MFDDWSTATMNEQGFSTMGAIIGIGILAVVATGVMAAVNLSTQSTSQIEAEMDRLTFAQEVQGILATTSSCTAALGGRTFDPASALTTSGSPIAFNGSVKIEGYRVVPKRLYLAGAGDAGLDSGGNRIFISQFFGLLEDPSVSGPASRPRGLSPLRLTVDASGRILSCEGRMPMSDLALATICASFGGTFDEVAKKCNGLPASSIVGAAFDRANDRGDSLSGADFGW